MRPQARRGVVSLGLPIVLWVGFAVLLAVSVRWGRALQRERPHIFLGAAPFVGRNFRDGWNWRFSAAALGAGVVAAVAMWSTLSGSWSQRSRVHVAATGAGAALFTVLLALVDGRDGLTYGIAHPTEYLAALSKAPPAGEFVESFVARINDYPVHVRGHPPGYVLLLKALDAIGLRGPWPVVWLTVAATAATAAGVVATVHIVAGPEWSRRAAPVVTLAPYGIWMMSSADAAFAAVGTVGVLLCVMSMRATSLRRSVGLGVVAGFALGILLFLTYAGAMFGLLPVAICAAVVVRDAPKRRIRIAVSLAVGVGVLAVVAGFAAAGFWWFDGVRATQIEYWEGTAQFRPWTYFAIANLAVAGVAVGPAALGGLFGGLSGGLPRGPSRGVRRLEPPVRVLVVGGLLALSASLVSPYTRGEVERIWVLFYPWIAVSGAAVVARERPRATVMWLAAQALCSVLLQSALVSKW